MSHYNIGIIGLGNIAQSFSQNLNLPNVTLFGCASRNFEKAQAFVQKYNLKKAYPSYEEMLEDEKIDIIYVCVPNKQHFEYCKQALLAKKHVLCEKAITTNLFELEELMAIAKKNHVMLQEAMTIFHMPLFKKIQEIIANNTLGKLQMIHAPFGSYMEPNPNNRYFNPNLGGGALLDIGTYAVSFFRYFLSEQPTLLYTKMIPFETGVDEKSVSIFQTSSDQLITMPLSFQGRMPKSGVLTFEKGYITIPEYPRADEAVITYNNRKEEILKVGKRDDAFNYEMKDFITSIENSENPALYYTHQTMILMDQLIKAWR